MNNISVKNKEKPFQKLLRLETLLKSGQKFSIKEIAKALKIDERSVFRYLQRLEVNGISISSRIRKQRIKEYWISLQDTTVNPKLLEAIKEMDTDLTKNGLRKYHNLLTQIQNTLNDNQHKEDMVSNLVQRDFYFDSGPLAHHIGKDNFLHKTIDKILGAIQHNSVLKITYTEHSQKRKLSTFIFHPYRVFLRVGKLYLVGYKEKDNSIINLIIPRIKKIVFTNESFEETPFNLDSYFKYCFGQWVPRNSQKPEKILLELNEDWVLKLFAESNFYPKAKMKRGQNPPQVELQLYITPDFISWLVGILPAIKVLEPLSLKQQLKDHCQRALNYL
ncbi:MAG: WYL domain-containing protein [Fibrobacter sp.]|nr:WYL domain-containing protein [Fibrobacter sp.]